ncbi:MAG: sulfotransferase [Pseudomonadota bacterium]
MSDYGALDRFLHRLALQSRAVAEMSFDIDQSMAGKPPEGLKTERHVFVAGLARAGTTALMRRFYASGAFRSLTYRDMPFVLAPNLWKRLSGMSRRRGSAAERAHGDGVIVDFDSPESLDEVFWRQFAGDAYLHPGHLAAHEPDDELIDRFVSYIGAIIASGDGPQRYLSKNNNNVLRLGAIRRAFPNALILVPFRKPMTHAASLLRQHEQFSEAQGQDAFMRKYMGWLAHHEFGLDQRPFAFDGAVPTSGRDPSSIDYWIEQWVRVYEAVVARAPEDAVFVCYEDLCADAGVWARLAKAAGIDGEAGEAFRPASPSTSSDGADGALLAEADALYERLRLRSSAAA